MTLKPGVFKKADNVKKFLQGIEMLTETSVMVGVPADKDARKSGEINNAALAYIHDKGAPEANIPARPFMQPGILAVKGLIQKEMLNASKAALKGAKSVESYLNRIGIIATRSIKDQITKGIPPPLAESTIRGRIARVKGKKRRQKIDDALAAGTPTSRQGGAEGIFTPLVVTGALRNSITYVLRKLRKGARR
jgi:hypothetical protein